MNQLIRLKNGIEDWNRWRLSHAEVICDLAGEDLSHGYFFEGNFSRANLRGASLQRACLIGADLRCADLSGADLTGAYLGDADLGGANLSYANLTNANLDRANLQGANLLGTQIADADIRAARLPDSSVESGSGVLASSISQTQLADESAVMPKNQHSIAPRASTKNAPQRLIAAFRQSLLQQRSLNRKRPEASLLGPQAIRQSAAPLAMKGSGEDRPMA